MKVDETQTDDQRQLLESGVEGPHVFRRALEVIQRHGISWISAEIPHTMERAETSNFDTWKDILKRYSKCTLLLSTDRLPVISGVAMRFPRLLA